MSGKKSKRMEQLSGMKVRRRKGQSLDDMLDEFNKRAKKINRKPKPRKND